MSEKNLLLSDSSILILVNNEGSRLKPVLDSCKNFAHLVVVAGDNLDLETELLLKKANAVIVQNKFIDFAKQRNFGLAHIKTKWVFVLDADEQLNSLLEDEIRQKMSLLSDEFAGYRVPRKNLVFGKILYHGDWHPDYQDRFYQTKKASYSGPVHERISLEGNWGVLKNSILHDNYHSINHYIEKSNRYTDLEAKVLFEAGKKFSFWYLFGAPLWHFWFHYFRKGGFKDGQYGLVVAWLAMIYKAIAIIKLWEIIKDKK